MDNTYTACVCTCLTVVCVYRGIVHSGGVQFGIPPRLVWRQLGIYTVHICSVSVKVVFVCVASWYSSLVTVLSVVFVHVHVCVHVVV